VVAREQVQRLRPIVGWEHVEPVALQVHPHEGNELVIVVHHEDRGNIVSYHEPTIRLRRSEHPRPPHRHNMHIM